MDTLVRWYEDPVYIKMCDCPEIQAGKPDLTDHDFLACPKHICLISIYHGEDTAGDSFKDYYCPTYQDLEWDAHHRIYIITDAKTRPVKFIDTSENMGKKMIEFVSANECKEEEWLWLPRQEDLQEMIGEEYAINLLYSFHRFYNVKTDYPPSHLMSMEQLWLAFAMNTLHSKQWDGEEWRDDG